MTTLAHNPYQRRSGRITRDQLPPYVRRWLAVMDRSADTRLTSYVPGYFDTQDGRDGS